MHQLFPANLEIFPGMPIHLPEGDGFILFPSFGPDDKNEFQILWQEYWVDYTEEEK